ncbi:hypothetical protein C6A37_06835 [Desulfobacteraceae bacterium SEEP-SAG9]|nr:hypothetical protein C6A37_06835 [Desulfobacteraceae bacterium SEEP-SAG9]
MLNPEVENRIRQINPWLVNPQKASVFAERYMPEIYIDRRIEETPSRPNRALLIVGPRQAGKSTMVWHRLLAQAPNLLLLNMEDPLIRTGCSDPVNLVEYIRARINFIKVIFIDEIQHMDEAGLFVKGIVDARLNLPLYVTGSSAFDLRSKTKESLAGRASRRQLMPFDMREILKHIDPPNPLSEKHACNQIISHQLVFGSYPSVYLSPETDEKVLLLSDLLEALILRDASDLFKIKRVDAFRKLLFLMAGQIGNLVNLSEIASICQVDVGTINAYIEILEESHVVKKISPFAGGKRREITTAPKVYFIDNGIRNQLLNNFSTALDLRTDKGQLLENWVFSEIYKSLPFQSSIRFWRSKSRAEVDFIIDHRGKIHALEVKFSSIKQTKLSRSAWSFIKAYKPHNFTVLNTSLEYSGFIDGQKVTFITPPNLPNWLGNILDISASL